MTEDNSNKIITLPLDTPEMRAFMGARGENAEIETYNVWRAGLALLGNPASHVVIGMRFHGPPDTNVQWNVAFRLENARNLHQALGELLDLLDDPSATL